MMAAVGVQLKNSLSGLGLGKAAARLGDRLEYLIAAFRRTIPRSVVSTARSRRLSCHESDKPWRGAPNEVGCPGNYYSAHGLRV